MTYEEFCEEEEAVYAGTAVRLVHCYLCEPDLNKRMVKDAGPLRGVLKETVTPGPDPYQCLHLSCGHAII